MKVEWKINGDGLNDVTLFEFLLAHWVRISLYLAYHFVFGRNNFIKMSKLENVGSHTCLILLQWWELLAWKLILKEEANSSWKLSETTIDQV